MPAEAQRCPDLQGKQHWSLQKLCCWPLTTNSRLETSTECIPGAATSLLSTSYHRCVKKLLLCFHDQLRLISCDTKALCSSLAAALLAPPLFFSLLLQLHLSLLPLHVANTYFCKPRLLRRLLLHIQTGLRHSQMELGGVKKATVSGCTGLETCALWHVHRTDQIRMPALMSRRSACLTTQRKLVLSKAALQCL